jgi:hypothetical protein
LQDDESLILVLVAQGVQALVLVVQSQELLVCA